MFEYKYYVEDDDGSPEDSYKLKSRWPAATHGDYIAEEAAENYHSKHDGWDSSWPLTFVILDEEGKELGRFEVDREIVPEFHASPKEEMEPYETAPR